MTAKLTWGQWFQLAIFCLAWKKRNAVAVDELFDGIFAIVMPKVEQPEGAITRGEAAEKIRTGDLSPDERLIMDRASQSSGGVG